MYPWLARPSLPDSFSGLKSRALESLCRITRKLDNRDFS
jgi:hypothetical protein